MTPADLRRRLAARDQLPVLMPGVWDALSTRLAVEAGFEVVFLSGYCLSGTLLGLPDYGYVTQVEVADAARRVCAAAGSTAVVVDGDTGYGNPLNVVRTVELFESAGAAARVLEDQVWPKRCGHMAGKQVVPADEWLAKLSAALDRRTSLLVVARTDARAAVGMDEALARAQAAASLGVDAVFVEAPESLDELRQVRDAVPDGVVLVANMVEAGRTPLLTPDELGELGYSLIVSPLSGLFAATKAMRSAFATLRAEGTLRDRLDDLVGFDEFSAIVDLDRHAALEARYVSPGRAPGPAGS